MLLSSTRPHWWDRTTASNLLGGEVEIIGCSTRDLRGSKPPLPAACHLLWCQSWLGHHLSEARKNEPIHLKTVQHEVVRRNFFDPGVTLNTFLWFETMYLPIQKTHVYSGSRIRKMLPARPLKIKAQKVKVLLRQCIALLSAKSQGILFAKRSLLFL